MKVSGNIVQSKVIGSMSQLEVSGSMVQDGFDSAAHWVRYWASLISATVEQAAPTKIVMTLSQANTSLLATDFTIAGKTITLLERDITNKILTLTVSVAVVYGDSLTITFVKTGGTAAVTNNVLYETLLTSIGDGTGTSRLVMTVSLDVTVTLSANAKFYTDTAGTLNESSAWNIVAGASRTIYVKCTTGTAPMTFSDITKVTKWGLDVANYGWRTSLNGPSITFDVSKIINLTILALTGICDITGVLPTGLLILSVAPTTINTGDAGLTLTNLPAGLQKLHYLSNSNSFIFDALPDTLVHLYVRGNSFSYAGIDFPPLITYLYLFGTGNILTGLNMSGTGNISTFDLVDYRINKMSSADMVTLLTSLTNRVGNLPATITINDYADYAAPPVEVTDAVATLKTAKSITTVNLGA